MVEQKSMVFYYDFRERNLSEIGNMTRTLFMAIGNIWTQLMTQHEAVRGQITFFSTNCDHDFKDYIKASCITN